MLRAAGACIQFRSRFLVSSSSLLPYSPVLRSFATARNKAEAAPPRKKLFAPNPISVVSVHGAKSEHVRILFQCDTPRRAQFLTAVCALQLFAFSCTSVLDYSLEMQGTSLGFLSLSMAGMAFSAFVMFPLTYALLSRSICEMAMMSPTKVRISTYTLLGKPKSFTVPTSMIAKMELTNESLMKSQFWLVHVKDKKGFFLLDKAKGVVFDFAFMSNMVGYTLTEEQQKMASGYTPSPLLAQMNQSTPIADSSSPSSTTSNNNNNNNNTTSSTNNNNNTTTNATANANAAAEKQAEEIPEKEPSTATEKWNAAAKK